MQETLSIRVSPDEETLLRMRATRSGLSLRPVDHAFWQARGEGVVATFYASGKLVIQSNEASLWRDLLLGDTSPPATPADLTNGGTRDVAGKTPAHSGSGTPTRFADAIRKLGPTPPNAWIGIDETGKGDYFGPLVTAAVRIQSSDLGWLAELGVGDSKAISDRVIRPLARQLREALPHAVVMVGPTRYNELYAEIRNLNKLLAWTHATAAEEVLATHDAELILSDQFAKAAIVPKYFRGPGRDVRYAQRTRAEDDPAVACASIIARAAFLSALGALEREHGVRLPKGAGSPVIKAGRDIIRSHGVALLPSVAKMHFKTSQTIGAY